MTEIDSNIISQLSTRLEIEFPKDNSMEEVKTAIANQVNYLINHDFNKLVRILYKVDISEQQLKINLQEHKEDAAMVIAEMIFEREMQKIKTRKQFKTGDDIPENEKW